MPRLSETVVGDAYVNNESWELLKQLVDIENRMAGHEGETEAANVIERTLSDYGVRETSITEFQICGWWRESSALQLDGDRAREFDAQHETIALPGSPQADVQGEIVDLGHGLPEDFESADVEGKLALVASDIPDDYDRWIHRQKKYEMAVEAGASGFLFRNHVPGCLPPTGSIGTESGPGEIPAIGLSREVGDRIVRYCDEGRVDAEVSIDCRNETTLSQNVEGVLGPATEEEILMTAHHDAHDIGDGARDNGAGSVIVAEVARLLSQIEDELETRVRFVIFGSEEVGLLGSHYWAETHDLDDVKCVVNLDGAGTSSDIIVYDHGFDAIGDAFEEAGESVGTPIEVQSTFRPHSDHWPFVERGVPGSQPRTIADYSQSGGRGWGHTHADSLDKLDRRDFRELSIAFAEAILRLSESDRAVERRSVDEIVETTTEQGFAAALNLANGSPDWPWDGT